MSTEGKFRGNQSTGNASVNRRFVSNWRNDEKWTQDFSAGGFNAIRQFYHEKYLESDLRWWSQLTILADQIIELSIAVRSRILD